MKIFILTFLFLHNVVLGQTINLTLELSTGDCRKNESLAYYPDTIRFYQNNTLIRTIIPQDYFKWPIEIEHFECGIYTINYTNLYGQKISRKVTIEDTVEYDLQLCADELTEYPFNSLAGLKNGQQIKINFSSQGCFHHDKEVIIIKKYKNQLWADLFINKKMQTVALNDGHIAAFKRFENEIRILSDNSGCTTVDTYTVIFPNGSLEKYDGGCSWNGYYFLKKSFFPEQEMG